jgi:zinc transport system ATP-binding protein
MLSVDEALVRAKDLCVAYGGRIVLEGITLDIRRGSFTAILGPNGAGKTTFLRTILGIIRPVSGEIEVFGKRPWKLGKELGRIGYVPQIHLMDLSFPVSVFEVVMMGRYGKLGLFKRPGKEDEEAVWRALDRVGIKELARRTIGELSGGERQRALIARALVSNPELLLLDEPTSGVDVVATESLYEMLLGLVKDGMTIIIASHDIGVVSRYVDVVACLNKRMVVHGRPEEVSAGDILECMYGRCGALLGHGEVPHIILGSREHEDKSDKG